jgi:tetratricopeptide (TPR) repeat protein
MSPEQAAGKSREISPAADVYALGAMLYELLTGRPPFLAAAVLDILEQVRSQDPVPPRRLQPRVPRDLETICLKCLQKEPRQRYPSAQELADDLHRFQAGEPIRARPTPFWKRVLKVAKRRPAAAALIVVIAGAASALAVGGPVIAARESQLRYQADEARKWAIANLQEVERQRKQALDLQAELARNYFESIGYLTDLGSHSEAVKAGEKCRAVLEKLVQAYPQSIEYHTFLASTSHMLGNAHLRSGHYKTALERYQHNCTFWEKRLEENPDHSQYQSNLANAHRSMGEAQRLGGQREAALRSYERARTILEKLVQEKRPVSDVPWWLAETYLSLGVLYSESKQWEEASRSCTQARDEFMELMKKDPKDHLGHSYLGITLEILGSVLVHQGNLEGARTLFDQAIERQHAAFTKAPHMLRYQQELIRHYRQLTTVLLQSGKPAEAATSTLERRKFLLSDPVDFYDVACDLARCVPLVGTDKTDLTPAEQAECQKYAKLAVEALQQAIDNGFKNVDRMKKDEALASLRSWADFQELINKLEKKPKSGAGQ